MKKPTRIEQLLSIFHEHGNVVTLGQLLAHPSRAGYKGTSRFSDMRQMGYVITCEKKPDPNDNIYRLAAPEASGQLKMAV